MDVPVNLDELAGGVTRPKVNVPSSQHRVQLFYYFRDGTFQLVARCRYLSYPLPD